MARMHQTTLRFGPDLWAALELEAELTGVSVAQWLREAAVARLAFEEGVSHADRLRASRATPADHAMLVAALELDAAAAVRAQGRHAGARSERRREEATRLRATRRQKQGGGAR